MIATQERTRNDNGFSTAWILGLVLLVFLIGATFYDIGHALVDRQKLVTAADRAANAGAMAIDEENIINNPDDPIRLITISTDPDLPTAVDRCLAAFADEKATNAKDVKKFQPECAVDGANPQVMIAKIQGEVSFGSIANLLGVKPKTFTVISRARPTCSNEADPDSEAC